MRHLFSFLLIIWASVSYANPNTHAHTESTALGIHGMAIFNSHGVFYASHMPLANSMHAHQIIFSFSIDKHFTDQLTTLSKKYPLLSLVPQRFDLFKLMNGQLRQFTADVYTGHFERGGQKTLTSLKVRIKKILLNEPLSNGSNGLYYLLPISEKSVLLIHKIGSLPSFDQILQAQQLNPISNIKQQQSLKPQLIKLTNGSPVKTPSQQIIKGYKITKELYLEIQDFR